MFLLQIRMNQRKKTIKPVQFICLSFFLIILLGTFLLMLPFSSATHTFTPFTDSLFTATSATCVTGLSVYDTYTHWSPAGQGIILLLIQVGGLGFVTFSTSVVLSLRGRLGLHDMRLAREQVSLQNLGDIEQLFTNILRVTVICEGLGALLLCIPFVSRFGASGIWMAVFTAVSSYCNAGFDIFGFISPNCSITPFLGDWIVMTVVPALIILGGIGFVVFQDIFTCRKRKKGAHHLSTYSKVVLVMSGILILFGFFSILGIEWNQTLAELPFGEKVSAAFFSSVTARTAGYSAINYLAASPLTKIVTILLMFIGASPVSTGGGIKTTTVVVLVMTMLSVLRGQEDTIVAGHRIKKAVVYKALSLTVLSTTLVAAATTFLCFTEPGNSFLNLAVVVVSAFSTTGLTTIDLGSIHTISKLTLCMLMYIGRVGPFSFILTLRLRNKRIDKQVTLPEADLIVG